MSPLLRLAARNVARNRRRTLITLAALVLGTAALVMLRAMSVGFQHLLEEDVVRGETGAFQVHHRGYLADLEAFPNHLDMPHDPALVRRLEALPGVSGVTPRIVFSGRVGNGATQTLFIGRGVDPASEAKATPRAGAVMVSGQPLTADSPRGLLITEELARSFGPGTGVGTLLNLSATSPRGRANSLDLEVQGLIRSPGGFESKRLLTLPLPVAQTLIGLEGRVTEYVVGLESLGSLDPAMAAARQLLGPDYEVHPWYEVKPFFRDVIARQRVILGLVAGVLLVIVLTGIANTMLMSVFERVREIGTMLSVGTRRRQVMTLFLLEAALLGLAGGALGVALGGALATAIAQRGIPFQMVGSAVPGLLRPVVDPPYALLILGLAVLGAVLASAYPAYRASRLDPVAALRAT